MSSKLDSSQRAKVSSHTIAFLPLFCLDTAVFFSCVCSFLTVDYTDVRCFLVCAAQAVPGDDGDEWRPAGSNIMPQGELVDRLALRTCCGMSCEWSMTEACYDQ